jgi:hypothetical protein
MDQNSPQNLPTSLYLVIGLFVIVGFYSAYNVLIALIGGGLKFDLGLLLIPCAYGLSQESVGWRKASIALSMVFLLFNAVSAGVLYFHSETLSLFVYSQLLVGMLLPVVVYFVLVSDKVEALFSNEH